MQIPKSIFIRQRLFFLYCIQKKRGKFYVRRICITRWCDQQRHVQLSADYHAAGGRTVFHTPKPFRTAPSASGINPGSRREDGQQLRIRISGVDGIDGEPCRHRQYRRCSQCDRDWRLRRGVLDVVDCDCGRRIGICREHTGADL